MVIPIRLSPTRLVGALSVAGCLVLASSRAGAEDPPSAAPLPAASLPAAGLTAAGPGTTPDGLTERPMRPDECLCLALSNSGLARALDERRASLENQPPGHFDKRKREARELLTIGLGYEADEIRNDDAGKALELYFRLAQARSQAVVTEQSLAEGAVALKAVEAQRSRGLSVGPLYEQYRRSEIELRGKQVELAEAIARLNETLRGLVGLAPPCADVMIGPDFDWQMKPSAPSLEASVAVALANRPQLILLRAIVDRLNGSNSGMAEQLLGAINPLLSVSAPGASLPRLLTILIAEKICHTEPDAVSELRVRVHRLLAWREQTVASEARNAARAVGASLRLVALAEDLYGSRSQELDALISKESRGLVGSLEVSAARLELLKAQSQWIDAVIDLHINLAKLDQAQGLLCRAACSPAAAPPLAGPR